MYKLNVLTLSVFPIAELVEFTTFEASFFTTDPNSPKSFFTNSNTSVLWKVMKNQVNIFLGCKVVYTLFFAAFNHEPNQLSFLQENITY